MKIIDIIKFNNKLNKYEYLIYNKRSKKVITRVKSEDFVNYYHYMNPEEFEKYNGGVCWDYCMYQSNWFDINMPTLKYKNFFIIIDINNKPTHTVTLIYLNDGCYWFESSWKTHCGIYKFRNEKEALSYIVDQLISVQPDYKDEAIYLTEYDPTNSKLYGMDCVSFMNYMIHDTDLDEYDRTGDIIKPKIIFKGFTPTNKDY